MRLLVFINCLIDYFKSQGNDILFGTSNAMLYGNECMVLFKSAFGINATGILKLCNVYITSNLQRDQYLIEYFLKMNLFIGKKIFPEIGF